MTAWEWLPFAVMLDTGLRVGDVVALRWADVDLDARTLRTVAQKTGKLAEDNLSASTVRVLESVPRSRRKGFIFRGKSAYKHLSRSTVWRRIKRAAARCGVPPDGLSPHSMRKHFAVDLYHEEGLAAVQAALQHSSDVVTRVYAFADTVMQHDSDEPIRWRDLEHIADYIAALLSHKRDSPPKEIDKAAQG